MTLTFEKLCPVHRGLFAMSGRVTGGSALGSLSWDVGD